MFCIECGFKNPDHAKFCANCGAQLILKRPAAVKPEPAAEKKEPAPKRPETAEPVPAEEKTKYVFDDGEPEMPFPVDADAPYKRPAAPGSRRARREEAERRKTVEPLESNPAQPSVAKNDWESAQDRFRKAFPSGEEEKEKPAPQPEEKPAEKPAEEPAEETAPAEPVRPAQQPHTVINSDGETVPEPKRMSASAERRSSTYVPKRNPLTGFDAFLDENEEDEDGDPGEKESFVERHLRSIITIILIAVAALALVLILASPVGKKLMYENGRSVAVPASTYAEWAAGYEREMKYSRAADAYHQALILEPGHYEYAKKVAENSVLCADYLQAYKALRMCIDLDPNQKVPYQTMREIYPNLPLNEKMEAEVLLNDGAHMFGDMALLP